MDGVAKGATFSISYTLVQYDGLGTIGESCIEEVELYFISSWFFIHDFDFHFTSVVIQVPD